MQFGQVCRSLLFGAGDAFVCLSSGVGHKLLCVLHCFRNGSIRIFLCFRHGIRSLPADLGNLLVRFLLNLQDRLCSLPSGADCKVLGLLLCLGNFRLRLCLGLGDLCLSLCLSLSNLRFCLRLGLGDFRLRLCLGLGDLRFCLRLGLGDFSLRLCLSLGDLCFGLFLRLGDLGICLLPCLCCKSLCRILRSFSLLICFLSGLQICSHQVLLFLKLLQFHLCLLELCHQHTYLLLKTDHLAVDTVQFLQCLFLGLGLLRQLCLGIQLCLGNLLQEHSADLYFLDIGVVDELFLDFLDELGLDHTAPFIGCLIQLSRISLQQRLENRVVGDQIGIHLDHIFFIELQGTVLSLDGVTHLIITLQKLPELITGSIVGILHDQVGTLDRASHLGAACHDTAEGAVAQGQHQTTHAVDPHED